MSLTIKNNYNRAHLDKLYAVSPAAEVSRQLANRAEAVAVELLPNGKRKGNQWLCGSVSGEEGDSLKVDLNGEYAGRWTDWNGGDSGDLLDLWQASRGVNTAEAIKDANNWLGNPTPPPPRMTQKQNNVQQKTKPTHTWHYPEKNGISGKVERFDHPDGKKKCLPKFPADRKDYRIEKGFIPPLYGSDKLDERYVFIVEGEKCVDAIRQMGLCAVTSIGGCEKASKGDWSALDGVAKVYLLPDHDEAGEKYMLAVAAELEERVEQRKLYWLDLPDMPPKGDIVDWVQGQVEDWDGYCTDPRIARLKGALREVVRLGAVDIKERNKPEPLPELDIAHLLNTKPPERTFMFRTKSGESFMPEGEGCGMAAPGGTGKSLLALQMAVALTTGLPWLESMQPVKRMPVFFFTKEDSEEELHRRLWSVFGEQRLSAKPIDLHVYPLLGIEFDLTMTNPVNGDMMLGPAVDRIIDIVNQHGGSGLVQLDPLRKMTAGDEDGKAMTKAIEACDRIRLKATGSCTTMLLHHSAKDSVRNFDSTQAAFRGATDLVDGLRWTMIMTKLSPKDRKNIPEGNDWRRLTMPKTNYSASNDDGLMIKWERGRFVLCDTPDILLVKQTPSSNARQLYGVLSSNGPMTERQLKDKFHKEEGPVFAAKRDIEEVIKNALKLGLVKHTKLTATNHKQYDAWEAVEGAVDD